MGILRGQLRLILAKHLDTCLKKFSGTVLRLFKAAAAPGVVPTRQDDRASRLDSQRWHDIPQHLEVLGAHGNNAS